MSYFLLVVVLFCASTAEKGEAHLACRSARCFTEFLFTLPGSSIDLQYTLTPGSILLLCPLGHERVLESLPAPKCQRWNFVGEYGGCLPLSQDSLNCSEITYVPSLDHFRFFCRFSPPKPIALSVCFAKCQNSASPGEGESWWFDGSYQFLDGPNQLPEPHVTLPYIYTIFGAVDVALFILTLVLACCYTCCVSEVLFVTRASLISVSAFYFLNSLPLIIRCGITWAYIQSSTAEFFINRLCLFNNSVPMFVLALVCGHGWSASPLIAALSLRGILIPIAILIPFWLYYWLSLAGWLLGVFGCLLILQKAGVNAAFKRLYQGAHTDTNSHYEQSETTMQYATLLVVLLLSEPSQLVPYAHPVGFPEDWIYTYKPILIAITEFLRVIVPLGFLALHHCLPKYERPEPVEGEEPTGISEEEPEKESSDSSSSQTEELQVFKRLVNDDD